MEVSTLLDVYVATPTSVNLTSFHYWCAGYSVDGVADALLPGLVHTLTSRRASAASAPASPERAADMTHPAGTAVRDDATPYDLMRQLSRQDVRALLLNDAEDQYRTFASILHYLQSPRYLLTQCFLPLAPSVLQQLLDIYYSYDDAVLRDLLGRRLSRRMRRDLDDVCERTGVLIQSAHRQFDNLQAVYKAVGDLDGVLVLNVVELFCLNPAQASTYACFVFLSAHQIETMKRRVASLTVADLVFCADQMLASFSDGQSGPELDQVFTDDLRDLKSLALNDSSLQSEMQRVLTQQMHARMPGDTAERLLRIAPSLFKDLLTIAAGLGGRDLRDFFLECIERVLEKLRRTGASPAQAETLLAAMATSFHALHSLAYSRRERFQAAWARFIAGMRPIVMRLWTRVPAENAQ